MRMSSIGAAGLGLLAAALSGALVPPGMPALGGAAQAQALVGERVSIAIYTYDDPGAILLQRGPYEAEVTDDVEFGLRRTKPEGLDAVPVLVDVSAGEVFFNYAFSGSGRFATAGFNGYELRYLGPCAILRRAEIDAERSSLALGPEAISFTTEWIRINVSGVDYDPSSRLSIRVQVEGCPGS